MVCGGAVIIRNPVAGRPGSARVMLDNVEGRLRGFADLCWNIPQRSAEIPKLITFLDQPEAPAGSNPNLCAA